ncbi:methyltransferase [Candidatus Bathyarchaeota archaeon]|nr:methyltransferase [Candidatus Bathyarchaeota archaeon]
MLTGGFREVFYGGLRFYVFDDVYEPAEDTFLLAGNLDVCESDVVLDMGTGCGILAILSAFKASRVVAVDINSDAVKCAKENAKRNNVLTKIDFICGDLFSPLKEDSYFSLIIFNPPYLPSEKEPKTWLEYSWSGGVDGRSIIDRFLGELPKYMKHGGRLLMVQSSLSNIEKTIKILKESGFKVEIIREERMFFETIALIRAVKVKEKKRRQSSKLSDISIFDGLLKF